MPENYALDELPCELARTRGESAKSDYCTARAITRDQDYLQSWICRCAATELSWERWDWV